MRRVAAEQFQTLEALEGDVTLMPWYVLDCVIERIGLAENAVSSILPSASSLEAAFSKLKRWKLSAT